MPATKEAILPTKTTVVSKVDLRGVPRGTVGKVIHVQGLSWTRYWVWFENGLRVGTLHRNKLATLDEWNNKSDETGTAVVVAAEAGGASEGGAAESIGGVPAHLIERSRKARERLGKPKP